MLWIIVKIAFLLNQFQQCVLEYFSTCTAVIASRLETINAHTAKSHFMSLIGFWAFDEVQATQQNAHTFVCRFHFFLLYILLSDFMIMTFLLWVRCKGHRGSHI